ncbi:metal ABC transporter solute-binding protein, Zn/Mn family [Nitratidesulfovibrio liaohensis]|uniref:metal ABC transporter solute-binding protein, Zn/Mn family n=1 Tax=Nitratidesulfovibrio liaohensis TaxID=2604158 RepID=UPI001420B730|nr:zinc ABC transporter substrate-binding protein [Nitratidesulfovibrio liaohensis]NHZ46035.1 cation ABC transporter substrate-binding protein [Nitratidesulfovibrio liaohensis]
MNIPFALAKATPSRFARFSRYASHLRFGLSALLFLFLLSGLLAAPGSPAVAPATAAAAVQVAVSILPQKYFIQRIAGDLAEVTVMVPPGADPHTYEPKPSQMRALASAKLYMTIGVPFEKAWLDRITSAGGKDMTLVRLEKGIDLLPQDEHFLDEDHDHDGEHGHGHDAGHKDADQHGHKGGHDAAKPADAKHDADHDGDHHHDGEAAQGHHHHDHEGGDPHIWLSPALVKMMAGSIKAALAKADPAHAAVYRTNHDAFVRELDELDLHINGLFENVPENRRRFMVFHPAWSYFAHNYNLREVAIEVEGREPGPKQLTRIVEFAKKEKIEAIFVQPQFSKRGAETIARNVGAKLIEADPLAEDWAANIRRVADAMAQTLTQPPSK